MTGPHLCSGSSLAVASGAARQRGAWASPVVERGLPVLELRPRRGAARPWWPLGMRDLPRSGVEPVCPALEGVFFTTDTTREATCMWILFQILFH